MTSHIGFADLHCHPNLKTFGHTFDDCSPNEKCSVWYYDPPGKFSKILNTLTGITRFSQSDFTTLSKGGAKVIVASLYPFERGFFINAAGNGKLSAYLSDLITGIGYKRIRYLQNNFDYFEDLENEYNFLLKSRTIHRIEGTDYQWILASDWNDVRNIIQNENKIAVILSIEGAHVFNTGLGNFTEKVPENEVLDNIRKVKKWRYPPAFITFAHNFDNDLCGHAHSLEPIKRFVDQNNRLNEGFTPLGIKVLSELLSSDNGRPVYIDIKHMSLQARKEYFNFLNLEYGDNQPPTLVSHGAVNGMSYDMEGQVSDSSLFYSSDINFYDEEIIQIGKYGGLFAIQFDARRIAQPRFVRKQWRDLWKAQQPMQAARMIWHQIRHIAEVLDKNGIYAWGTACIGSDYDGTIDPLPGIWTAEHFTELTQPLLSEASHYLNNQPPLVRDENRNVSPEEIVDGFLLNNSLRFFQSFF